MSRFRFAALAAATAVLAWSSPVHAQDVTLRYSNWLPAGYHLVDRLMKPWIAEVERVTEGRVKVEMTPKVVGSVAGQYDVLADGLADLSLWVPGYSPGRFPLIEGFELPFLGNDPVKRSLATWQIYEKYIADTKTFENIHVVSIFASNSSHPVTAGGSLTDPTAFKGLKLRTPSPVASEALDLLGAVAVPKPMSELYEMASSGIVDGAIMPMDTVRAFKLETVFKNVSIVDGGMNNAMIVVGMNPARWEEISEADRAAITAISGAKLAEANGALLQEKLDEAMTDLAAAGMTIATTTPEQAAAFRKELRPIWDDWIAKAKENGLSDPDAFLNDLTALTGSGM